MVGNKDRFSKRKKKKVRGKKVVLNISGKVLFKRLRRCIQKQFLKSLLRTFTFKINYT